MPRVCVCPKRSQLYTEGSWAAAPIYVGQFRLLGAGPVGVLAYLLMDAGERANYALNPIPFPEYSADYRRRLSDV